MLFRSYAENLFRFGNFTITPGLRVENVRQEVREEVNLAKFAAGNALAHRTVTDSVPLAGLAATWELPAKSQAYVNLSQSFRPVIFTQAVPNGATQVVNADLRESRALQMELGFRGEPAPGMVVDVSVFHLAFDDQVGVLALPGGRSTVANVGRAEHRGVEFSFQQDQIGRAHV